VSAAGRTFRRSLSVRILSLVTTLFLAGAAGARISERDLGAGFWIIALLALVSLIGLIGAWGDRVHLDGEGVEIRNVLWSLLRLPGRRLAWRDVVAVREHRRLRAGDGEAPVSALFLVPRSGRRLVLDSLQNFDEAHAMVARLCRSGVSTPLSGPPR
jgi:hypothetical protein